MVCNRIKAFGVLAVALLCATPNEALTADAPATQAQPANDTTAIRVCTPADLTGTYKLQEVIEKPPGDETKWFQEYPNHYLFFSSDSVYGYVASKHPFSTEDELQKTAKDETVGLTHTIERKYTLDSTGLLNMTVDGRPEHSYRCVVLLKPLEKGLPGDMELWGYSKTNTEVHERFVKAKLKASDPQ